MSESDLGTDKVEQVKEEACDVSATVKESSGSSIATETQQLIEETSTTEGTALEELIEETSTTEGTALEELIEETSSTEGTASVAINGQDHSDDAKLKELTSNPNFQKLLVLGFDARIAEIVLPVIESGNMNLDELDERAVEAVKSIKPDQATTVLEQFATANLEHVSNKSSYLCSLVKTLKDRIRQLGHQAAVTEPLVKGPDEAKLKELLDRTGYPFEISIGQRKYGGPPPNWEGPNPGSGCEVYVGKIPKEIFEVDLIPLFEECGQIWDLRLMMDPITSQNRGYCFITFTNKEAASKAAKKFDNHEIRRGKHLKCNVSVANTSKGKEDIKEEFSKLTGIDEIIVYPSPDDPVRKKNRGFCFIQFIDHKNASTAKKKLSGGRVKPWNCDLVVDWAEVQEEPDNETMSKVKALYVKNLKPEVTEELLKEEFGKYGELEKVRRVKDKDYAFVHFEERDAAVKAMEELSQKDFDGSKWDITLAKPQMDKGRRDQMKMDRERRQLTSMRGFAPRGSMMPRGGGGGFGMRGGGSYPPPGGPRGRRMDPVPSAGYASSYGSYSAYDDYGVPGSEAGYYDSYYPEYPAVDYGYGDSYYDSGASADYYAPSDPYGAYGDGYGAPARYSAAPSGGARAPGGMQPRGRGRGSMGPPKMGRGAPGGGRGGGGRGRSGAQGGYGEASRGGMKRKAGGGSPAGFGGRPKRARGGGHGSGGDWNPRPIAQQPGGSSYDYSDAANYF